MVVQSIKEVALVRAGYMDRTYGPIEVYRYYDVSVHLWAHVTFTEKKVYVNEWWFTDENRNYLDEPIYLQLSGLTEVTDAWVLEWIQHEHRMPDWVSQGPRLIDGKQFIVKGVVKTLYDYRKYALVEDDKGEMYLVDPQVLLEG